MNSLKQERYNNLYMDIAFRISKMSQAKRLNVGCVIVKNNNIISFGWNGMPAGWYNNCEHKRYLKLTDDVSSYEKQYLFEDDIGKYVLETNDEVLHAEQNAITKLARGQESGFHAEMYITHAPCITCAKLILQTGINEVFYKETYKTLDGVYFLRKSGINVEKLS